MATDPRDAIARPNRWTVAIAAAAVMLTIGTIYSWGIFTQPLLVAFQWDVTVTTWAYAIANFSLAAIGGIIGGFWQDKVGPRTVAMTGVTLWGAGNVLAGLGTADYGLIRGDAALCRLRAVDFRDPSLRHEEAAQSGSRRDNSSATTRRHAAIPGSPIRAPQNVS